MVTEMSDVPYEGGGSNVLGYRVGENSKHILRLQDWRSEVDKERAARAIEMENMSEAIANLTETVNGLRKALLGFAFTIAGSAVVFALSILVATGKL